MPLSSPRPPPTPTRAAHAHGPTSAPCKWHSLSRHAQASSAAMATRRAAVRCKSAIGRLRKTPAADGRRVTTIRQLHCSGGSKAARLTKRHKHASELGAHLTSPVFAYSSARHLALAMPTLCNAAHPRARTPSRTTHRCFPTSPAAPCPHSSRKSPVRPAGIPRLTARTRYGGAQRSLSSQLLGPSSLSVGLADGLLEARCHACIARHRWSSCPKFHSCKRSRSGTDSRQRLGEVSATLSRLTAASGLGGCQSVTTSHLISDARNKA